MLTVELVDFNTLSDAEKMGASNNGSGKEYANYIRVSCDGTTLYLESDAMEPEDCSFGRDLSWIVGALRACYEVGKRDGAAFTRPAAASHYYQG